MTNAEWGEFVRILKSNWGYTSFLPDKAAADFWFNVLNRYKTEDIREGITDYIMNNREAPTLADLVQNTEAAEDARKLAERLAEEARPEVEKTVKCRECNDKGYSDYQYPNGSTVCRPCGCPKGRSMFPSYFMTRKEYIDYATERNKKGDHPCVNPVRAEKEFVRKYLSTPMQGGLQKRIKVG